MTDVKGEFIQDWKLVTDGKKQELHVVLNQPQTKSYALCVRSEMILGELPATVDVPVIVPQDVIRSGGAVVVGTDSTIQLVVRQTSDLAQIDAAAFPRRTLPKGGKRAVPQSKAFYYTFVASNYRMQLQLSEIVPSYDVVQRLVMQVKEDDLAIAAELELDIRDAGVRQLQIELPPNLLVANVTGNGIDDYHVGDPQDGKKILAVNFTKPVRGRTTVALRLELGRGPLGAEHAIPGISVVGAKNQRGYLVLVPDRGVKLNSPTVDALREVHTGSIPMRVANAQVAYRFREPSWALKLKAGKEEAAILTEAFHLISLGEGVAYGCVVVNYLISGAPVDELQFRIPATLKNVEFVGSDVLRWQNQDDVWTVKLRRRVQGDYNLGINYTQPYRAGDELVLGAVQCQGVETHGGYVVVASNLNLELGAAKDADKHLLTIDPEEVPANYRLLVNAPILGCYKYVDAPHSLRQTVRMFPWQSSLPVLVEVTQLRTEVNVNKNRETQSVTRIRYKVKNLNSQYLTLALPENTTYLTTRLVYGAGDREELVEVRARVDEEKGVLMVPLKRYRNPNQPLTVELEYGQTHGDLTWGGQFRLDAPKSYAKSTFADWQVHLNGNWVVFPLADSKGMRVVARRDPVHAVSPTLHLVKTAWQLGFERWQQLHGSFLAGGIMLVILLTVFFVRRSLVVPTLVGGVAFALMIIGLLGAFHGDFNQSTTGLAAMQTLTYTQAASLSESSGLFLEARVLPLWRCFAVMPWTWIVLGVAATAAIASWFVPKRWRPLPTCVAIAAGIWSVGQFPHTVAVLKHLLTWGAPAVIVGLLLYRLTRSIRYVRQAAVLLAIACFLGFVGNVRGDDPKPAPKPPVILQALEGELNAEKDGLGILLKMRVKLKEDMEVKLLPADAILMEIKPKDGGFKIDKRRDAYYLVPDPDYDSPNNASKPEWDVQVRFLTLLAPADRVGARAFSVPLPPALTNSVNLRVPHAGQHIESPSALLFAVDERKDSTTATAVFSPGEPAAFSWRPRARKTSLEQTVLYAQLINLFRFDAGSTEGRHRILLKVVQGELKQLQIVIPENSTVTGVDGADVGGWRFDPKTHALEIKFAVPITGDKELFIKTQVAASAPPANVVLSLPVVRNAEHQRAMVGVAVTPSVTLTAQSDLQRLNVADFVRTAGAAALQGVSKEGVRAAYRVTRERPQVTVQTQPVLPELRVMETAVFTVADDRLVYNASLAVTINRAGVFAFELTVPDGYDIDALTAPELSHWDDDQKDGKRTIRAHLRGKIKGTVKLMLAMSRPVADLPSTITVPRVHVKDVMRHTGTLTLSADQSVRLSVDKTKTAGVSALPAAILGERRGQVGYKLLKPDWRMTITTEVVKPRINVDFLHHVRISEGVVRHRYRACYRMHNAGTKVLRLRLPKDIVGLQINGPEIARQDEESPGVWRVELERKWFERRYPLTISYETRFDRREGRVPLQPVEMLDVHLQRGYVAVFANERVELAVESQGEALQPADARRVSGFGRQDLSSAAFCFRSLTGRYELSLRARRHGAADQLDADVLSSEISTVVTRSLETLNQLRLRLRVNDRRYLGVQLPAGAEVWSLLVNQQAARLSKSDDGKVLLIPLQLGGASQSEVSIDLIYVTPAVARTARRTFELPQFDLPLKQIQWRFYLPEEFDYDDFEGNLTLHEPQGDVPVIHYGLQAYEEKVSAHNHANLKQAERFQAAGNQYAVEGKQKEAKRALLNAYNYSFADPNLNEDARVQLHGLIRQQAIVGLVGRRGRLREQHGGGRVEGAKPYRDLGDRFSPEDAQRIQNSLSKNDSKNLDRITERIIAAQEAAQSGAGQLSIQMPLRGKLVTFDRPLQVEPNAHMSVSFDADPIAETSRYLNWLVCIVIGVVLTALPIAGKRLLPTA